MPTSVVYDPLPALIAILESRPAEDIPVLLLDLVGHFAEMGILVAYPFSECAN